MRTREEKQEIERHKYFLSEKRGYDVGWELAERDWEEHHSAAWREARGLVSNGAPPLRASVRPQPGGPRDGEALPRGRLRRWLGRLFS